MNPSADPAAWVRLGELLTRRRTDLDARYRNRTLFAAERGLDYRLCYDIEEHRRANFRTATLAGIAAAYGVTADSVLAVLRNSADHLEPASPPRLAPVPSPPSSAEFAGDLPDAVIELLIERFDALTRNTLRALWALDMPRRDRLKLIKVWLEDNPAAGVSEARRGEAG